MVSHVCLVRFLERESRFLYLSMYCEFNVYSAHLSRYYGRCAEFNGNKLSHVIQRRDNYAMLAVRAEV